MIFLKKYFLQKQISLLIHQQMKIQPKFVSIQNASNVGVVVSCSSFDEWKKECVSIMQWKNNQCANIYLVVYIDDTLKVVENSDDDIILIGKNHFSVLGRLSDAFLQNFKQKKIDILIDINTKPNLPIVYLQFLFNSQLRVGRNAEKTNIYDLVIQAQESLCIVDYLAEVEKYLKQLSI